MMKRAISSSSDTHRDGLAVEEEEEGTEVVDDVAEGELALEEGTGERQLIKCMPMATVVIVEKLRLTPKTINLEQPEPDLQQSRYKGF